MAFRVGKGKGARPAGALAGRMVLRMIRRNAVSELDRALGLKILIPYFGSWPSWFPFFLRSCAENPGVEWVLFSDCGTPTPCPSNVRIVEISFTDYCGLVSERLGIDFAPLSSRKLCDIKPALAEVHADHLEGARF